MLKFFALVALTVLATANATSVTGASVFRGNLMTGVAGDLVIKFTPTTALAVGNTITLTVSSFTGEAIFSASDASTSCTAALATGTAPGFTTLVSGTETILTLTLTGQGIAAGVETTITCAAANNLAVNGAVNNVVQFQIQTTTDSTDTDLATGYTITNKMVGWTSASRTSLVTGEDGGSLTFKFTPLTTLAHSGPDTITLTPDQGLFSAMDASTHCTATLNGGATAPKFTSMVTDSHYQASGTTEDPYLGKTLTLTLFGQDIAAGTEATVVCTTNLAKNSATEGDVKFSISTSKDIGELAAQTGYTLAAASSTSSVSMLTMLALAGVAMRQ